MIVSRIKAMQWILDNLGDWPSMESQKTCEAPDGWQWSANLLRGFPESIWENDFRNYANQLRQQAKDGDL